MNCLCCGKPLKENEKSWHKACIKRFFSLDTLPEIKIDNETLELLAKENVNQGLTIPGVQKKLSLHISKKKDKARLTLVNYPTGYILKPQVSNFKSLPEAEQLAMTMAEVSGISVVPHALIENDGNLAYITKRIDRCFEKNSIKKYAMEDFCQLDLRPTSDKYKGSYERCAKIIKKYSSQSGLDLSELFLRLVFSFVIGNSDMHLKNFSLIEKDGGKYVLSPAYDLLPVNVIMPEDEEEFALTLRGKKRHVTRKDFLSFGEECEMNETSCKKLMQKIVSLKQKYIELINESYLPNDSKKEFIRLIEKRCDVLDINR